MADELVPLPPDGQIFIYQDGRRDILVRVDGSTIWLTQRLIAELYQTSVPNINQHLSKIYAEGELSPEATIKKYLMIQTESHRSG